MTGAELVLCESDDRHRSLSTLFLPNGTLAATTDWRLSGAMAREALRVWDAASVTGRERSERAG